MTLFRNLDPQLVLDSIYNGVVIIDSSGRIIYFNKTSEKIFNIAKEDALNRYVLDVLPNTGSKLLDSMKSGDPFKNERLEGEAAHLVANMSPVFFEEKIIGAIGIFLDVSEIERISQKLELYKNMQNWLDAIIDSSYDGLWICDKDLKVLKINKASARINEVDPDAVVGRNIMDMVREGMFDRSVAAEVLRQKRSVTMLQTVKGKKKILVTGNPIFDQKGEISFVVTNDRDISELNLIKSQLIETQELARGYISKISELELKGIDASTVVFRSLEFQRVIQMAIKCSKVDSTILLLGESGVGKGMIAKLIHKNSERNQGPFIRVDCAGVPESLIESELFGYEKGAFTGAKIEGKPGLFELANMGTLFLDEIGEIPMAVQSKLLRFLEEYEIIRIGGTTTRRIDVRVIAATNRNVQEMVEKRQFRQDLYYRLNIVPMHIPPLRERKEDISPLIMHFLEKFNRTYQQKKSLSSETVDILCRYDYPGNVRELANLIERLLVVSEGNRVEVEEIPFEIKEYFSKENMVPDIPEGRSLKDVLNKYEMAIIKRAINHYGTQKEAARALKVNQASISRKMKRFGKGINDLIMHN